MAQTLDELARSQIQKWIATTGITQTELAARVGKNQAWMSRYLNGDIHDADLETLQRIAGVFQHSIYSLLQVPADPEEAALIAGYRSLRIEARRHLFGLIQDLSRGKAKSRGPGRSR